MPKAFKDKKIASVPEPTDCGFVLNSGSCEHCYSFIGSPHQSVKLSLHDMRRRYKWLRFCFDRASGRSLWVSGCINGGAGLDLPDLG